MLTQLGCDTINLKKSNHSWIGLHLGKVETDLRRLGLGVWRIIFYGGFDRILHPPKFCGANIHKITVELGLRTIGEFQQTLLILAAEMRYDFSKINRVLI